ncbi:GGDEF domain-containing protein [Malaciobacter sp. WC5094]|uniref:GGDEF domain-containing protein n=1 Tax=Arcobacter sp. YIC-80 TaxID=3376683 RepID=UPI00385114AE
MILNFTYNFREYGIKSIDNKATILAKTVEHALTTQMLSGVIDEREIFLKQLEDLPHIEKIWLSRGHKVIQSYGEGLNNEVPRDEIDRKVLETGKEIKVIDEKLFSSSTYRITIPYKATANGEINCLNCHANAKEGDTLGAITITIPIDDSKQKGISTVLNTTAIALILIFTIAFLINYLISPFLKLFVSIKKVMSNAHEGDYSQRVLDINNKDAKEVSTWINTLLEKLESTLNDIDSNISIFLSSKTKENNDPLVNVQETVSRLSSVYKFRKTIEHDDDLDLIYKRLADIIKNNLSIENFNILEADTRTGDSRNVYIGHKEYCDLKKVCRADKTNQIVDSSLFENICSSCKDSKINYLCIPYSISNDLDLIVSIYSDSKEELEKVKKNIPFINDYVDAAKSVIITNKLMCILEKNARTDALTNLYNRKHLEDQLPKIESQSNRANISYGVLMIDIDFFKQVNDTYGHDIGDKAIQIVAQTLTQNTRASDIVIRYGGEEFIVLLHNCDEEGVMQVAEKIRVAFMQKDIPVGGTNTINKTLSIGTSIYPKDSKDLKECIKNADIALYEAKNSGRNKTVLFKKEMLEDNK